MYVIIGTYNRNIHLFNQSTYEHVGALKGHVWVITSVTVSPCEGFCFTASSDSTVKVNIQKGARRKPNAKKSCSLENKKTHSTMIILKIVQESLINLLVYINQVYQTVKS